MTPVFEPEHLALLAQIQAACAHGQPLYLVGGAVRDALLGKPLHDMDFVMGASPTPLAKKLSKQLQVGFFILDDERHTARVVYYDQKERFFPLDFVQFTGHDLEEDLRNRDFTINAMAVPVEAPTQVIDLLTGQADLKEGILRPCSPHALLDDPVRVLRGVRLAIQLGFSYAPGLEAAMQTAARQLQRTSNERQRDEFFRLLDGPNPAEGLRHFRRLGVFDAFLPVLADLEIIPASPPHQLPLFEHTIKTVEHYHQLVQVLTTQQPQEGPFGWYWEEVLRVLRRFSNEVETYFKEQITPGRSKAALAYLGALLHDVGKPLTVKTSDNGRLSFDGHAETGADLAFQTAKQMPLSNAEAHWIKKLVQHHMHLTALMKAGQDPDRRTIYRFFRHTGDAGIAVALHTLADSLATYGEQHDRDRWRLRVRFVEAILSAWWEAQQEIVAPTLLLNGKDLQTMFGLAPGKMIGSLLSQLEEAQASGYIHTMDEALEFIKGALIDQKEKVNDDENGNGQNHAGI